MLEKSIEKTFTIPTYPPKKLTAKLRLVKFKRYPIPSSIVASHDHNVGRLYGKRESFREIKMPTNIYLVGFSFILV